MFKDRYNSGLIEEAQKTFDVTYSKPLMNTLKKASSLPNWAGGGLATSGAAKIASKRGQLANQMKEARSSGRLTKTQGNKLLMADKPVNPTQGQQISYDAQIAANKIHNKEILKGAKSNGAVGRADAAAMSQHNSPFVTMKDHSNYKSMNTDNVFGNAMSDDEIRHMVQIDGSLIRGSKPSFTERISNKAGRGIENTAVPFVVDKTKKSYNYAAPIVTDKVKQGYNASKQVYKNVAPRVDTYIHNKYNDALNSSKNMYSSLMQRMQTAYENRRNNI